MRACEIVAPGQVRREFLGILAFLALSVTLARAEDRVCPIRDFENYPLNRSYQLHGLYRPWVFNRAMTWLEKGDGVEESIIAYSAQSPLLLTGKKGVSAWYTVEPNKITELDDEWTRFEKKDPKLTSEYMCLPAFQFEIDQNPVLEVDVREASSPWQLAFTTKGRNGSPIYRSEVQIEPGKLTVSIRDILRRRGYTLHYGEVHLFMIVYTDKPKDEAGVECRVRMPGSPAVVPCYPVFRTIQTASGKGAPIYAVVVDEDAHRLGKDQVSVAAKIGEKTIALTDAGNGVWKAALRDLPVGMHQAVITATRPDGSPLASSALEIVVNDGQFVHVDRKRQLLAKGDKVLGPLSGSFVGLIPAKLVDNREVFSQSPEEYKGPEHYVFHWYESLTEPEYEQRFAFLKRCGWTTVYFFSGWASWERLEMAGKLAPHGAELWAMILQVAQRHDLRVAFSLTHYSYHTPDTSGLAVVPYVQLTEAGYTEWKEGKEDQAWASSTSALAHLINAYFRRFTRVFGECTQLYFRAPNSEYERTIGVPRFNEMCDVLRAGSPQQLIMVETYGNTADVQKYRDAGWKADLGGIDTYYLGDVAHPDEACSLYYKALRVAGMYVAEGCFPRAPTFQSGWYGTRDYRTRVRDLVYLGLVSRCPIIHTWDEKTSEDERIVFEQVRRAVDWNQAFRTPPITLRLGLDALVPERGNQRYLDALRYEAALARLALDDAVVWGDDPAPPGTLKEFHVAQPYAEPKFASDGGWIPDVLKTRTPLSISPGYSASYSWSADGRTLIAYVRNTLSYGQGPGEFGADNYHRRHDKPADLSITLHNLPDASLECRLYDLETKQVISQVTFRQTASFPLGQTTSDYLVLVVPTTNPQ